VGCLIVRRIAKRGLGSCLLYVCRSMIPILMTFVNKSAGRLFLITYNFDLSVRGNSRIIHQLRPRWEWSLQQRAV